MDTELKWHCASCGGPRFGIGYTRVQNGAEFVLCKECSIQFDNAANSAADPVTRPAHYRQGKVECIDAIEAATIGLSGFEGMLTGNTIKYLFRWKHKNGLEDLKKAKWYLEKLIGIVEGGK